MASSAGEQIVQAMVAALNAPGGKPCTTYRTRIDALSAEELPAMLLHSISEEVQDRTENVTQRTRTIRLEMAVKASEEADAAIDALYVFAIQTLAALDLAALIRNSGETRIQWDVEASLEDVALAAVDFQVIYFTNTADPTEVFTS